MWSAIGQKTRGYTHILKNSPCQDAFDIRNGDGYIIAAVADGHGSPSCPFSEEGARTAARICADIMEEAVKGCIPQGDFSVMKQNIELYIPKKIDYMWKTEIKAMHEARNRIGFDNLQDMYLLYGTTLLCLAVTPFCFCALQLGDGDILAVSDSGDTSWVITPGSLSGTETDSLCQKDSWSNMRVFFSREFPYKLNTANNASASPRMFLLSTDGYSNSYADASEFLRIGGDYLHSMREYGTDYIKEGIADWLAETSKGGSGDDITLVIIFKDV